MMAQNSANEWFYSSSTGRNSSGITLSQLNQLISQDELHSDSQVWHPTYVPKWTQLQLLPKSIQKLLNIDYYKMKSKQNANHRSYRDKSKSSKSRSNHKRDVSISHSHSHSRSYSLNNKHFHAHHPKKVKKHRKPPYKHKNSRSKLRIHNRASSDSQSDSSPTSNSNSHKTRGASSSSTTPTVSASSTTFYDYNTENRSKSKSKKMATIHKRSGSTPILRNQKPSGYILQNILSSKNHIRKQNGSNDMLLNNAHKSSSDYDSDQYRNTRKLSMGSDVTIPPPFPMDNISDIEMNTITAGNITPRAPSEHNRMRKSSDSFVDITSVAPVSDFTRNFVAHEDDNNRNLDEKYENDDEHTIKTKINNSKQIKKRESYNQENNSQQKRQHGQKWKETKHITRITKKGKVAIKRSTEKYKKNISKKTDAGTTATAEDPDVTLKQFIADYNDIRRDRLCDKLQIIKKEYNELNANSLGIEKKHFNTQYIYRKNDVSLRERCITKEIECYEKGIALTQTNMKSSKQLQQYIASQLNVQSTAKRNKKKQRELHRKQNEILKKDMEENIKLEFIINKTASEMMEEISKQNKSMRKSREKAQERIESVASLLDSVQLKNDVMETTEWKEIITKNETLLEIPHNALSSEGDTKLDFDELHDPLHEMYKRITKQSAQWFRDRTNIREQCMIHRMFWKKYTQWMSLQNKMNEMKKRENEHQEYTQQLIKDMNDTIDNDKMDKFQLKINKKQAIIHAKQQAVNDKKKTLNDLQNILSKYRECVAIMNQEIDDTIADNDAMQNKIEQASQKRYKSLIHSPKMDHEMKEYIMIRKDNVTRQQSTLEHLWHQMNQKRYKLKSLQYENKQMKQNMLETHNGNRSKNKSNDFDVDLNDMEDEESNDVYSWRERVQSEKQRIQKLNEQLLKRKQDLSQIQIETEQKEQMKLNHDKSLRFVQQQHDELYEKYKELNGKIDKLNDERHGKFKQMFGGILSTSTACLDLGTKRKQKHEEDNRIKMEVDDVKEENKNEINEIDEAEVRIHGERSCENDEKSSEVEYRIPGKQHEPGTTPPMHDNETKTGGGSMEMLMENTDSLCAKNNKIILHIFDDLRYVYDLNDDLDFEQTTLSLRSVMDSIRNNRAVLNETLLKEKEALQRKEKEIEQSYKRDRRLLKKEREIQKKEFQKERKKIRSKELLQRMVPTMDDNNCDTHDEEEESLSLLSDDLQTGSSDEYSSENERGFKSQYSKRKKMNKSKHSKRQNKKLKI